MKRKSFDVSLSTVLNMLLLVSVALLLASGVLLVREKLMRNTHEMGMSLAKSYAIETELRLDDYRKALGIGRQYVEEMELAGTPTGEIHEWIRDYSNKLLEIFDGHKVDPYAVIGDEIVSSKPWIVEEDYDYRTKEWYQDTIEAGGEAIFTDVYEDAVTGRMVFSVCQLIPSSGDILAIDIYLDDTEKPVSGKNHLFLLDTKGKFIYSPLEEQQEEAVSAYMDELLAGVENGSLLEYNTVIRGPEGLERGVYYAGMENGWTVIMTIPIEDILMGKQSPVIYLLVVLSIALFLILLGLMIRDVKNKKKMDDDDGTIQILSDSFFAIYRVNFETGAYTAIKKSPDLVEVFPDVGEYSLILNTLKELVHPRAYQEFERNFCIPSIRQRVAENIADYGGDYQRRFRDGYKWINIRTMYKKELAPHEVILCFRDVDVEKQQQLQHIMLLEDALDSAKQSAKAKTTFFSNMSHDMRTPLNAIIGFSALALQSPGDCSKHREYMKKIEFSAKLLLNLINDILEVSRMEAGRSALDSKAFQLRDYMTEIVELFQTQAVQETKKFEVELDIRDEVVKGDPFKISQILNNILSNAFKYTNKGDSIRLKVRQSGSRKGSKYQFIVSDTGIGMSEEFVSHIFDPYARETHFLVKAAIGTGLGMSIVKNLVEQMGGEISVESRLGEGSRFTVTIPLETVAEAEPEPEKSTEANVGMKELSGRKILVAEDNELNMEIVTELLTMNGIEVVQAYDGKEALELFRTAEPYSIDAILMDMQMPVMDGCEAARAIRQLEKPDAASIPIIAVTANAFAEDIARTASAGMNCHIAKPIDFEVLRQTLADCLQSCER